MNSVPSNPPQASEKRYQSVHPAALDAKVAEGLRSANARKPLLQKAIPVTDTDSRFVVSDGKAVSGEHEVSVAQATTTRLAVGRLAIHKAGHAAKSIGKTFLGIDRLPTEQVEDRLDICRHCPGSHATFKKSSGELHTCGPMLESLRKAGEKTCGCVLKLKAVDAKEDCPYGYWPTLESEQIVRGEGPPAMPAAAAAAKRSLPELITADKTLVSPRHGRGKASVCRKRREGGVQAYSESQMREFMHRREIVRQARPFDPSRRRFIGSAAAAGASALVFAPKVFGDEPTKYLTVDTSCGTSGSYTHVPYYEGWKKDDIVKADDDNCYKVTGCESLTSPPSGLASSASEATCADCGDPLTCLGDCADNDSQPNAVVSGVYDYNPLTVCGTLLNQSYQWVAFFEDQDYCEWYWGTLAPNYYDLVVTLFKGNGQIVVTVTTNTGCMCQKLHAEGVLVCVGGVITGTVAIDELGEGSECANAIVTFGG